MVQGTDDLLVKATVRKRKPIGKGVWSTPPFLTEVQTTWLMCYCYSFHSDVGSRSHNALVDLVLGYRCSSFVSCSTIWGRYVTTFDFWSAVCFHFISNFKRGLIFFHPQANRVPFKKKICPMAKRRRSLKGWEFAFGVIVFTRNAGEIERFCPANSVRS